MIQSNDRNTPVAARILGYAGILPFAALALLHAFGDAASSQWALRAFLVYGAVILSFLGGIRWGLATRSGGERPVAWLIAVLPSLWGFAFVVWPNPFVAAWALLLGFAIMGLADALFPAPGSAPWMMGLRVRVTLAVLACHVLLISSLILA